MESITVVDSVNFQNKTPKTDKNNQFNYIIPANNYNFSGSLPIF